MRGPLPHVKLMPTGGVTSENAGDWIRAGAVAIGVGTALVDATGGGRAPVRSDLPRRHVSSSRPSPSARPVDAAGSAMTSTRRLLRRNHDAAESAGRRAAAAVARAVRRPSAAVRRTSPSAWRTSACRAVTSRGCPPTPLATPPSARCAREGVDVEHVQRGGSRLGIYFAETGASQRRVHRDLRPRALGHQRD